MSLLNTDLRWKAKKANSAAAAEMVSGSGCATIEITMNVADALEITTIKAVTSTARRDGRSLETCTGRLLVSAVNRIEEVFLVKYYIVCYRRRGNETFTIENFKISLWVVSSYAAQYWCLKTIYSSRNFDSVVFYVHSTLGEFEAELATSGLEDVFTTIKYDMKNI